MANILVQAILVAMSIGGVWALRRDISRFMSEVAFGLRMEMARGNEAARAAIIAEKEAWKASLRAEEAARWEAESIAALLRAARIAERAAMRARSFANRAGDMEQRCSMSTRVKSDARAARQAAQDAEEAAGRAARILPVEHQAGLVFGEVRI